MNTQSQLSNTLAELSPTKRKLLELRLRKRALEPAKTQIPRREKSLHAPLSFAQQRLWFLEQLQPNTSTYIMANALPMLAPVNEAVLEQALNEIVRRHEVLRTVFAIIEGSPSQVVSESVRLQLPYTDLSALPESDRHARILRFINEIKRPFDLQRGPLLRATLLRLTSEQYVLYLALHHIVADGWSLGLFAQELAALYDAFSLGKPSPLTEPSIQYADFAVWQREWLKSDVMADQLEYWKKQLDGVATLNLRGASHSLDRNHRSAAETATVSANLAIELKALAQREGVTLFMTLLAAFQLLLARYTGQTDIVVGSPVAGRSRVETESLIGCFVNMLILRSDLSGNPSFSDLLRRVKEMSLRAYENQQVPFEMLVEELRPQRDLTRSPLFQVMFALESSKSVQSATRDVFYTIFVDSTAKYDLTFNIAELERDLLCSFDYDSSLFEAATIRGLLRHFQSLLKSIVEQPDCSIFELTFLAPEERQQLVTDWNHTRTDVGPSRCVHQLIEAQAQRVPNRVAVSYEREHLTYQDLDRRANWLAQHLRERGVQRGHLVGICLERSIEMVVSLLAVLKTGAAYVPLDPSYPTERLRFMQQDAELRAVITQKHLLGSILEGVETICWENLRARKSSDSLNEKVIADDLAYVIYTSGSTGTPKGVAVRHGSVVNLLESMRCEPGIGQEDRLLAVTTLSFDIAALELFLPLAVGAQVVLASRETANDPRALIRKMDRSKISIMQATPATWQMLMEAGWTGDGKLKVLCGGETLTRQLADQLLDRVAEVWNMYGPTETTIWSSTCPVQRESGPVCLGRGIANTQFYVLDNHRQLLPIGVPGELYIGGKGVAGGYWKRPELTSERFVSNPFRAEEGYDRLYRTGDLVRYHEDGKLEYLGRMDHQVKIRGYRFELGEIEAGLQELGVREAVVTEDEDQHGNKRLIGYFVSGDKILDKQELRRQLKKKLPEYMVPALLIELKQLPLSPAGKVDRNALPKPELIERNAETLGVTQDPLELQLTKIWERVLGCPVGFQDDFFELGGHSFMAVRLFIEMEKVFGRTLPLATLFNAPTVEQLASVLRTQGWEAPYSSLVPLQPRGTLPPFFCVHSLGANLVSYRHLAVHLGNEQPFYGLQPQGLDGKKEPHSRLEDMAAHYIKEIKTVQSQGPYFLGGVCLGGVIAFEMAQQLRAQGDQVERVILIDSHFPVFPKHYLAGAFRSRAVSVVDSYLGDILALNAKQKFHYVANHLLNGTLRVRRSAASLVHRFMRKDETATVLHAVLQRVKEANALAEASYVPQYYPGRLIQLWCSEMPTRSYKDRRLAWSEVAGSGLEVHVIPGNHMTMIEEPHIAVLAEKLRHSLETPSVALSVAS
jgi:surfactin family lipopeptide synthetase A